MHSVLLCLVLSFNGWIGNKFECDHENNFCPSYETRRDLQKQWNVMICVVYCVLFQIISPFCYYYIKNNSLRQDTVATVDRTLGEMIKLGDWIGIRELIAFGFLFDKQAYLNILFKSNYQIIGHQTLWAIIEILAKNYSYTYNFSIMAAKRDSTYFRIIRLICDLKENNSQKYDELKLFFDNQPKTKIIDGGQTIAMSHFNMSLELTGFELNIVSDTKKREIYEWIKYWQAVDSIQYLQSKQYIRNIGSYLAYGLKYVDKSSIIDEDEYVKVVVLGAKGVGKNDLIVQFVYEYSNSDHDRIIEDSYLKTAKVDMYDEINQATFVRNVTFNILETGGQEEFLSMQAQWMREHEYFILVYSVFDRSSFDNILVLLCKIAREHEIQDKNLFIVIVGNVDKKNGDENFQSEKEDILPTDVEDIVENTAEIMGGARGLATNDKMLLQALNRNIKCKHFRASPTSGENVSQAFEELVRMKYAVDVSQLENENVKKFCELPCCCC